MQLETIFTEMGFEEWKGWAPVPRKEFTESQIAAAIDLIDNKARLLPHRHEYAMKEAITSTTFPTLFGVIVDREMMARYQDVPQTWQAFTKQGTLSNFNQGTRNRMNGGTDPLPRLSDKGEYPVMQQSTTRYTRQVYPRGKQFDISWMALINDGMGAFDDIPVVMGRAAANTEAWEVASLIASATGPNALLFGTPIADVDLVNVTNLGGLALSGPNLQTTMAAMAGQTDRHGMAMRIRPRHLVVPQALEITARTLLTSNLNVATESAGGALTLTPSLNILPQMGLQLHVFDWLDYIDVSGNVDTTWYLFGELTQCPAIGFDRLLGHEGPKVCMKASDKVAVGGGGYSPYDGDFATDNVFYRVRVCQGGNYLDPRGAYAQVG